VPVGAAPWRHDPFGAVVEDGRLYGRGASDMKGGVAAIVCAALQSTGRGLTLVFTAGEETGCEGAFHLVQQAEGRAALGNAVALVVAEPTANAPWPGHKGALWLRACTHGRTAHGSMPGLGENAVYKLARAALAVEAFAFDTAPHALMGMPTINVGTVAGGANINSVPDRAEMTVDLRSVAGQDHEVLRAGLQRALGPAVDLQTLLDVPPVCTDLEDPWFRRACAVAARVVRASAPPATASYFTDAAALRPALGMPPTLILGPGRPDQAHQTDEFVELQALQEAQAIYAELIREGA
jgi:succinyl-diaminopimelate desuccinylase